MNKNRSKASTFLEPLKLKEISSNFCEISKQTKTLHLKILKSIIIIKKSQFRAFLRF